MIMAIEQIEGTGTERLDSQERSGVGNAAPTKCLRRVSRRSATRSVSWGESCLESTGGGAARQR